MNNACRGLLGSVVLLAGCGGGGSGSEGGDVVVVPAPGTAITPTPTPGSSPSPTPTPTVYAKVAGLGVDDDARFEGIGFRVAATITGSGEGPQVSRVVTLAVDDVGFSYVGATRTYDARFGSDRYTAALTSNPVSTRDGGTYYFNADTNSTRFSRYYSASNGVDYVGSVAWVTLPSDPVGPARSAVGRGFQFGERTRLAELPVQGTATFRTSDGGAARPEGLQYVTVTPGDVRPINDSGLTSPLELLIDWRTNVVSATITVTLGCCGAERPPFTIRLTGMLDRTTGLARGQAVTVDSTGATVPGGYAGEFAAVFFGPAAINGGLALRLARATGDEVGFSAPLTSAP